MPLYAYICEKCEQQHDLYFRMNDDKPEHPECPYCGGEAYRTYNHQVNVFQPYVCTAAGEPFEVVTRQQERDLPHTHGIEARGAADTVVQKRKKPQVDRNGLEKSFLKQKARVEQNPDYRAKVLKSIGAPTSV